MPQTRAQGPDRPFPWKPALAIFLSTSIGLLALAVGAPSVAFEAAVEDGVIEYTQALLFLASAVAWLASMRTLHGDRRKRLFYALFALVMLFLFLEEISWGQRILGTETPSTLEDVNVQGETNLHNLGLFGSPVVGYALFGAALFTVAVALPLLNVWSQRGARALANLGMPVIHQDMMAGMCTSLAFYSDPGFHWYTPLLIVAYAVPLVVIASGRLDEELSRFQRPFLQFLSLAVVGALVVTVNSYAPTSGSLEHNVAYESRELLMAIGLLAFPLWEAAPSRKNAEHGTDEHGSH